MLPEITYVRVEIFTAVTMKNGVLWDVTLCGSFKNRRFEERGASIVRAKRIGELGTTLAVTSNRATVATQFEMGFMKICKEMNRSITNKLSGLQSASELFRLSDRHWSENFSANISG
jgi:hypothetical protein